MNNKDLYDVLGKVVEELDRSSKQYASEDTRCSSCELLAYEIEQLRYDSRNYWKLEAQSTQKKLNLEYSRRRYHEEDAKWCREQMDILRDKIKQLQNGTDK